MFPNIWPHNVSQCLIIRTYDRCKSVSHTAALYVCCPAPLTIILSHSLAVVIPEHLAAQCLPMSHHPNTAALYVCCPPPLSIILSHSLAVVIPENLAAQCLPMSHHPNTAALYVCCPPCLSIILSHSLAVPARCNLHPFNRSGLAGDRVYPGVSVPGGLCRLAAPDNACQCSAVHGARQAEQRHRARMAAVGLCAGLLACLLLSIATGRRGPAMTSADPIVLKNAAGVEVHVQRCAGRRLWAAAGLGTPARDARCDRDEPPMQARHVASPPTRRRRRLLASS